MPVCPKTRLKKPPDVFGLLGRLHVVQWERVLKLALRDRAVDIYNIGALVGIVTVYNGLGMLFHKADGRVR